MERCLIITNGLYFPGNEIRPDTARTYRIVTTETADILVILLVKVYLSQMTGTFI